MCFSLTIKILDRVQLSNDKLLVQGFRSRSVLLSVYEYQNDLCIICVPGKKVYCWRRTLCEQEGTGGYSREQASESVWSLCAVLLGVNVCLWIKCLVECRERG